MELGFYASLRKVEYISWNIMQLAAWVRKQTHGHEGKRNKLNPEDRLI